MLILSETLHPAEIAGTVLIIGGLLIANSKYGKRRLYGRAEAPATPARAVPQASPLER